MNYDALKSKLKAMKSYLFTQDDYADLACSKNIKEILNKLKDNIGYQKFIREIDEKNVHRSDIERKLFLSLRNDFKKLYRFVFDFDIKKYLDAYFLKDEIYVLKLILCMIYDKKELKYNVSELKYIIDNKLKIDIDKLRSSENVEQFIFNLSGTEFFDFMRKSYDETKSLFELEVKMDLYYYMKSDKIMNRCLSRKDKSVMQKLHGIEIDLVNVSWLYRIKKYYNIGAENMFCYLIPLTYKLEKNEIVKLASAKNLAELENMICHSVYGNLFMEKGFKIERAMYDYLLKTYRVMNLNNKNSVVGVVYYLYLKKLEINNITSIIEGVRYKLNKDEIMSYVYV